MKLITKLSPDQKRKIYRGKKLSKEESIQLTPEQMQRAFSEDPGEDDTLEITEGQYHEMRESIKKLWRID